MRLNFSSKGSLVTDSLFIIVFVVLLIMGVMLLKGPIEDISNSLQNDTSISPAGREAMATMSNNYASIWDSIIIFALVFLWIGAIVAAYYIGSNPAFMIIGFIFLLIMVLGAMWLSDGLYALLSDAAFSPASFPISMWIVQNLPYIALAISITIGISLYSGSRSQ